MNLLLWLIFGGIVGWIASLIMKTERNVLIDITVGLLGALLGGWLMTGLGYGGVSGFNIYSFLVAILGSVILVILARIIWHKSGSMY